MLGQCTANALQALYKRHLAPVPHHFLKGNFVNPFLTQPLANRLQALYRESISHNLSGEWKVGKPAWKVAQIEASHAVDAPRYRSASSFIKLEVHATPKNKSRLIQGHANLYTAYQHPEEYVAFADVLKHLFDDPIIHDGTLVQFCYSAGKNHVQLSEFINHAIASTSKHRMFDERDGKNWDATMNEPLLRAEAAIYEFLSMRCCAAFLKRCQGVKGHIKISKQGFAQILRYFTLWRRLSGDWNTSVGNTIISMIITWNAIFSLPRHLRPTKVYALFMGDDYLAVYDFDVPPAPRDLAQALNHHEQSMGITPERGIFINPLRVSFAAMTLWPTVEGQLVFLPKPATQMCKLFWSAHPRSRCDLPGYSTAIAIGLWPLFHGLKFMMRFLRRHLVTRPNFDTLTLYQRYRYALESPEVRWDEGFVSKYDLPLSALDFDIPIETGIYFHPAVQHMLKIEGLDPMERRDCLSC